MTIWNVLPGIKTFDSSLWISTVSENWDFSAGIVRNGYRFLDGLRQYAVSGYVWYMDDVFNLEQRNTFVLRCSVLQLLTIDPQN